MEINRAYQGLVQTFGQRSVVAADAARVFALLELATLPFSIADSDIPRDGGIMQLGATFNCNNIKSLTLQEILKISEPTPKVLTLQTSKNVIRYQEIYCSTKAHFGSDLGSLSPIYSYPYVVLPCGKLVLSAIANLPEDVVTPRSSLAGRVVHPILAAPSNFEVLAAGEISYLSVGRTYNMIISNASGHFRPASVCARLITQLLSSWLLKHSPVKVLVATNIETLVVSHVG